MTHGFAFDGRDGRPKIFGNQFVDSKATGALKAFGAEGYESRRFSEASRSLLRTHLNYVAQQAISSPMIEFAASALCHTSATFVLTPS